MGELVFNEKFSTLYKIWQTNFLFSFAFSWGRWTEIQEQGQFKRGWAITDIEDCARVIVSKKKIKIYISFFFIK